MIALTRYFEIPFSDPAVSAEELRQFTENHLAKTAAQNESGPLTGVFTTMLAATQTAFDAFDAALTARATALAAQGGGTVAKDDVVRLFKTTVRQRRGRVLDKFGEGSPEFVEFFPRGLSEYSRARMGQVPVLLERMVAVCTKYAAQVGADMVQEFTTLKEQFGSARGGQLGSTGELTAARTQVAATRAALELQLTANVLDIAKRFLGQPARAADYFTQSLLENPDRNNEDAPQPPTPPVNP